MCMGLNITKSLFVWSRNVSYIYYNFQNIFYLTAKPCLLNIFQIFFPYMTSQEEKN